MPNLEDPVTRLFGQKWKPDHVAELNLTGFNQLSYLQLFVSKHQRSTFNSIHQRHEQPILLAMDDITRVVRIQPAASGPTYQVTIEMQSTPNDDHETYATEKEVDESPRSMKPDILPKHTTDRTTSQASGFSRDNLAKSPETKRTEQPIDYESVMKDPYTMSEEIVPSVQSTAGEKGKDDEAQRDLAERRMKALDLIPEDDKEGGRECDREAEEAIMARMDAEIEEIRIEVEKMRVLAQAAEDELSRCGPCGLRLISHALMDDQIRVSRRRIKRVE
ncbi:hypothetical protein BKA61DRAFT_575020 [Leptodontidium sp. MPI-SDFR-AT-0119]|nr:hypothetical protein BKA61DRAFT_575020 [Leptodontidium sp. MPI-SDFR-AT-0119]